MVLAGTEFSPSVQSRIPVYPVVCDPAIDPKGSPFITKVRTLKVKKGEKQAVALPNSERPGYSKVYRNTYTSDRLVTVVHPAIQTVDAVFRTAVNAVPNSLCMGERKYDQQSKTWGPYIYQTFAEIDERISNLCSGIINVVEQHVHLEPFKEQYVVGLYGPNSRNWVVTDLACSRTALTAVPLYDTLGPESTKYIVNLTDMPIIFASISHIHYLLSVKKELPTLKIIVSFNELDDPDYYEHPGHSKRDVLNAWAESVGVKLYSFGEIEELGKHYPREHRAPVAQDIFTINFTSGTTGNPKGVILRQSNLAAGISIVKYSEFFKGDGSDCFLSFLPLAHIYERLNILSLLSQGNRIGFIHGDIATTLFDDIKEFKPSMICGVPRIWNKMVVGIKTTTLEAPGKVGELSKKAYQAKLNHMKKTGEFKHPQIDPVWTDNIRKQLGFDNALIVNSGSAPISSENIDFVKLALGVEFVQGYGLTESTSGICVSLPGDVDAGASNGPVIPTTEVCLRDLPEMGYSVNDKPHPRGELMLRGPQIFQGYYKNEEETAKAIEPDGWFHTGDVAMIDDIGRIYIVDRVKNMFKLAQGEYVGPERIESLYSSASPLISQIFVDGNSFETYLVGIIGVTVELYVALLKSKLGITVDPTNVQELEASFKRKDVRRAVLRQINNDIQGAGLKGFEQIKNLALFLEPLNATNGTLTPTMKIKRPDCRRYFNSYTSELYKEGLLLDEKPSRL